MERFISIIIPAHNEEKYIADTLRKLAFLDYPQNRFEVIVIENGSNDKTFAEAKNFENNNIAVFSSLKKGVSAARNFGIDKLSPDSDWAIFMDADTVLESKFLKEFNDFINKNSDKNYVVGVTSIRPLPPTPKAKFFFTWYDLFRAALKVPFTIMLVKKELLDIKFDETLSAGEDLDFVKKLMSKGNCFFLWTDSAATSIRRFEKLGWFKVFVIWIEAGIMPHKAKKKIIYDAIR